jgi:ABC-2 type transport system ATP-binding protein
LWFLLEEASMAKHKRISDRAPSAIEPHGAQRGPVRSGPVRSGTVRSAVLAVRAADAAAAAAADAAIVVSDVTKKFDDVVALDGFDLTVRRGSVHGFLGPNGAGKSTTIRILLGLYRATSGRVRVLGMDPAKNSQKINQRCAYVPAEVRLWPALTGAQCLDALANLRGRRNKEREAELIERFALDPYKKVRTYSRGNRQKIALIAALAAPVDVLILDEPTSGLDPLMEHVFAATVREAQRAGQTVLLSSHILTEVQNVCSDVTIIRDGRAVESGALADLRHLAARTVTIRGPRERIERLVQSLQEVHIPISPDSLGASGAPHAGFASDSDLVPGAPMALTVEADASELPVVMRALLAADITDFTVTQASLEDLFLRHYAVENR